MYHEYVKFKKTGYLGQIWAVRYSSSDPWCMYSTAELSVIIDGTGESVTVNAGQVELLTKEQYLKEKEKQEVMMRPASMNMTLTGGTFTFSYDNHFDPSTIKDVIFNDPATIILWKDGTKTVVKCQEGDTFNPEFGFMAAVMKKLCGNKGNYNDVVKKWVYPEK